MISWQIILFTLSIGLFYSLVAIGFGFLLRSTKFFNVSYSGALLVGGYMMFLFYRVLSVHFLLSLVLSMFFAGLYMWLSYKFIFRILLERKAKNFTLLITSFGLLTATSAVIGMVFGSQSNFIARHLSDVSTVSIWGATINLVQATNIIITPIIICISALVIWKTRFGRAVRAVEDDAEVAELVGIPKDKIIAKLFFISGIFAGFGGVIEGFDLGLTPQSGLFYMLPIVVIAIVGGMRSFWGGIIGAFVMAIAQELTIVFFGGTWVEAVPFVILIIILLVRPEGILKK